MESHESMKSLSLKENLISNKGAKLLAGNSYINAVSKGTPESKSITKLNKIENAVSSSLPQIKTLPKESTDNMNIIGSDGMNTSSARKMLQYSNSRNNQLMQGEIGGYRDMTDSKVIKQSNFLNKIPVHTNLIAKKS